MDYPMLYCPKCGVTAIFMTSDTCDICGIKYEEVDKSFGLNWENYIKRGTEKSEIIRKEFFENTIKSNPLFDEKIYQKRLKIEAKSDETLKYVQSITQKGIPRCPTCQSTNIEKIGAGSKVGAAVVFGIFSLGHLSKTFRCGSCGYKW